MHLSESIINQSINQAILAKPASFAKLQVMYLATEPSLLLFDHKAATCAHLCDIHEETVIHRRVLAPAFKLSETDPTCASIGRGGVSMPLSLSCSNITWSLLLGIRAAFFLAGTCSRSKPS